MLAWFICPMKQKTDPGEPRPYRYCGMDDFTAAIRADGGDWSESEVLGGYAVVKVRASDATLTAINAATGFVRVPKHVSLNDTLSDLTIAQRNTLRNLIEAMGYTPAEISGALGTDIRNAALGQVLRFTAQRRLKPRWDDVQQQIVLDGIFQACRSIDEVDAAVSA
jgi:hypothetical protein